MDGWRWGGGQGQDKKLQTQSSQMCDGVRCLSQRLKVAADEVKRESEERPAGEDPPEAPVRMVRVELEWDVPMSVTLPVQVGPDPTGRPFPFLDTTLADLGIAE